MPGGELLLHRMFVGDRVHRELDAEGCRVGGRQVELQALGPLCAQVVAGRQVQRHDAQFAARADFLERAFLEYLLRLEFAAAAQARQQQHDKGESECAHEPPLTARAFR